MIGPMCQSLPCLVPLRIVVLLMVLALISTEWVTAQSMHSLKSSEICRDHSCGDAQISKITSRITSVEQTVDAFSAKMALFAAMEQNVSNLTENVNSLTARMCKIETNATSVSSGSDSARSWNILGRSKGSTATGSPLGPMAQGHLMTVEIRGVLEGTPSPVQSDNAVNIHPSRADTYVSNAVSPSCRTWTSPRGAAMSAPPRRSEHSPATLRVLFIVFTGLVVTTKPPH